MKDQKFYWETKIVNWEKSAYSNKLLIGKSLFEKFATPFRKALKKRLAMAEKLLAQEIKNKVITDLGCGTGLFLKRLLKYKPKKIIGVDIAPAAIRLAKLNFKDQKIKTEFICADVRRKTTFLEKADIIIGIGFIDYFGPEELLELLKKIKNKKFIFSFPAKVFSLREMMQKTYLKLACCPGFHKYSRKEMDEILKKAGLKSWWYYDKEIIRFLTNLPELSHPKAAGKKKNTNN